MEQIKNFLYLICLIGGLNAQIIPGEFLIQSQVEPKLLVRELKSEEIHFSELNLISSNNHIYLIKTENTIDQLFDVDGITEVQYNIQCELRNQPNDPFYASQWQHKNEGANGGVPGVDMKSEIAWGITTGGTSATGREIVVAVIDDGIDTAHTDLKSNLWVNSGEIRDNGLDDDLNGIVDDYFGYNPESNDGNVHASSGVQYHGTRVTGMIAAVGDNGIGVSGINWNVKVMTLLYGQGTLDHILAAYDYVLTQKKLWLSTNGVEGAYVVSSNASFGWSNSFPAKAPLWCAMYDSLGKYGVINVGATANSDIDVNVSGDLPTTCPSEHLITVTNLNNQGDKVSNAAYGIPHIDLAAPGEGTYTTAINNGWGIFNGTSAAAPQVTGAITLAHAIPCAKIDSLSKANPELWSKMVIEYVKTRTTKTAGLNGITTTGGYLNIGDIITDIYNDCDQLHQRANGIAAGINNSNLPVIQLYPNPTNKLLYINSPEKINQILIRDIQGKTVKMYSFGKKEIDLSGIKNGLYYITLSGNWGTYSQRIIKE